MALKNLFKALWKRCEARKEKEKFRRSPSGCTTIMVGLGDEDKKRYYVPTKFLGSILPILTEDELDRKTDGPIRIYCSTDFFDQILEALKNDVHSLSMLRNADFRNL